MTVVAARELRDGEIVFVGIGLPNLACNLARATHAPGLVLIYESGAVGALPERLPVSIGDPSLVTGSLMVTRDGGHLPALPAGRTNRGRLPRRRADRQVREHQHDRGGRLREAEGAAAREWRRGGDRDARAAHADHLRGSARARFPRQVDYITSPGNRSRRASRAEEWGMPGAGPVKVITDRGVLCASDADGEMELAALYPGVADGGCDVASWVEAARARFAGRGRAAHARGAASAARGARSRESST